MLAWFYGFVRLHRRAVAPQLSLSKCASMLVLAQPWLTKTLIDDGLRTRDLPMLVLVAVAMIVAGILYTLLGDQPLFALLTVRVHPVCLVRRPLQLPADVVVGLALGSRLGPPALPEQR